MRKAHPPDPVRSVWPIWSADCGHSSGNEARHIHRERLARRKEEFVALDERYLARKERVFSLASEVDFLVEENRLFENKVVQLEREVVSHVLEVSSLKSCITDLDFQPSVAPANLLSITQGYNRY